MSFDITYISIKKIYLMKKKMFFNFIRNFEFENDIYLDPEKQ